VASRSETVSIVIVTYNSQPALQTCLGALSVSVRGIPVELIVVDNDSDTDPTDSVRERFADARVIRLARNVGFAAACNRGAAVSAGEMLLFLNPDVFIDDRAVETLRDRCVSDSRAGLLSGRLRFPDGSFQATCRNFPTAANLLYSRGSILSRWLTRLSGTKPDPYTLPDSETVTEVPAVAGTMMMVRRSLFEKAGGFDERFFLYMEDTDLSLRVNRAGYRNLFVPTAGAVHDWGKGGRMSRVRRLWRHHYSVWQYFLKHEPNAFALFLLPLLLFANGVLMSILPRTHLRSSSPQ
jgi:GT2 family glycosyltransferase